MRRIFIVFSLFAFLVTKGQETVYYNARIFTGDRQQPFAEAIAIRGKLITAIGTEAQLRKKISSRASWVDLQGGFLMPGIVDSHNHGIAGGRNLTKANLDDVLLTVGALGEFASNKLQTKTGMTGDVLVIYGINISAWQWLDQIRATFNNGIFTNQAVLLKGSDGHTAWGNAAMMKLAGLDRNFIANLKAEEKTFYQAGADHEPTGFVSEEGVGKFTTALPKETDFSEAAVKTMQYNNQLGITAWLDPSITSLNSKISRPVNYGDWYRALEEKGQLSAHIRATVVVDADKDPQQTIRDVKAMQQRYNKGNFAIIGLKIFADGVVEHPTHTAAMSLPYSHDQSKGVLMFQPENFARLAVQADKENLLVHVHAIGDRAVTASLDGFAKARQTNGDSHIPHTITHLQFIRPADFDRFRELGILASFQLLWAFGDVTTIDIVKPCIDPSLYTWQYPVRSLLQAGATVCGASDWPVSSANPFQAISRAETRQGPMGVLDSSQCMPRLAMLYAYTSEAAKALRMEKQIGSLQPGKSADMILLDRDLLTIDPKAVFNTRVVWTIFEGKKVYEAPQQ